MNAPARITQRPIVRPSYTNAPVTLETFERWFIANYYELRRYCQQLEQLADEEPAAPDHFLLWAQCQYDIAKRSPTSSDPQSPRNRISSAPAGEFEGATADLGAAKVSLPTHDEIVISQYRQAIYAHERLIEKLYDLARAERYDELHDLVRAEYRDIHGPRD